MVAGLQKKSKRNGNTDGEGTGNPADINNIIQQAVAAQAVANQGEVQRAAKEAAEHVLAGVRVVIEQHTAQLAALQELTKKTNDTVADHEDRLRALELNMRSGGSEVGSTRSVGSAASNRPAEPHLLRIVMDENVGIQDAATAVNALVKAAGGDPKFAAIKGGKVSKKFKLVFEKPDSGYASGGAFAEAVRNSLYNRITREWTPFVVRRTDGRDVEGKVYGDRSTADALLANLSGCALEHIKSIAPAAATSAIDRNGSAIMSSTYQTMVDIRINDTDLIFTLTWHDDQQALFESWGGTVANLSSALGARRALWRL